MEKILKEVVGIDVAQKELVASMGMLDADLDVVTVSHKVFRNTAKGIVSLIDWASSHSDRPKELRYVMEATGVYHEHLAHALDGRGLKVSILLPNKISNYVRTLEVNTITDKTASQAIMRFGLERKLDNWVRPKDIYRQLKQLTRERDQIVEQRAMAKNQLHAEKTEAMPNEKSLERIRARIMYLSAQEKEVKRDIKELLKDNQGVRDRVRNMCTMPGVAELTAVTVLAETNGFELIRNKKQLTSYAGFDVREKQSGTSVKGKPRISKKGNRHLRKAMHLPSLSSVKYNEAHKDLYVRLVSKSGIKMKALIAVQRKMLELIYVIDKTGVPYDKDHQQKRTSHNKAENVLLLTSFEPS